MEGFSLIFKSYTLLESLPLLFGIPHLFSAAVSQRIFPFSALNQIIFSSEILQEIHKNLLVQFLRPALKIVINYRLCVHMAQITL